MRRPLTFILIVVFTVTPVYAAFTESFETNPFGHSGNWERSGSIAWTGSGPGNDYVRLGQSQSSDASRIWQSFTATTTGQYSVSFDYRFVGAGRTGGMDNVNVQIGQGTSPLFDVFSVTSNSGLAGGRHGRLNSGSWQNATPSALITLNEGQTYWVQFTYTDAAGYRFNSNPSVQIDNIGINKIITTPLPGTILLGCIGVAFVGWLRTRNMLS